MKFKFTLQFSFLIFIPIVLACQKDTTISQEKKTIEKLSYVTSIRNELDHSNHSYFYNEDNNIRRYYNDEYRIDFLCNDEKCIIKEETSKRNTGEMIGYKEFNYNSEELIDTIDVFRLKEEEYQNVAIIIFEYNQQRQIVKEIAYYPVVMQMEQILYQYDEKGNQTRMEHYDVYIDTTILTQYVTYEYDTCKNAYKGINYPFSFGLLKKNIHDYPNLSKVNNITRVNVFDWNDILYLYTIYDYQNYTENNYPHDFTKTIYNENGDVLITGYYYFNYLEEELLN